MGQEEQKEIVMVVLSGIYCSECGKEFQYVENGCGGRTLEGHYRQEDSLICIDCFDLNNPRLVRVKKHQGGGICV